MREKNNFISKFKNIVSEKDCLNCFNCCYFSKAEINLLPILSNKESQKKIYKGCVKKIKNSFWQIKQSLSKKNNNVAKCFFLDEGSHKCKIYKDRPFECAFWPFVISFEKNKIYICSVNKDWCPEVTKKKIFNQKTIDNILQYLESNNIFKELEKKERYIWPMEDYYIKVIEITNKIKKDNEL